MISFKLYKVEPQKALMSREISPDCQDKNDNLVRI